MYLNYVFHFPLVKIIIFSGCTQNITDFINGLLVLGVHIKLQGIHLRVRYVVSCEESYQSM